MSLLKAMAAKRLLDFIFGKVVPKIADKISKKVKFKLAKGEEKCSFCGKVFQSHFTRCPFCGHLLEE